MTVLLEVEDVTVRFGGVQALQGASFQVHEGELLSLIGPNGAGKTTLLRVIAGVVVPEHARIRLDGREISRMPTHRRAQLGLSLTHQIVRPFRSMTLLDNVTLAAGHMRVRRIFRSMLAVSRDRERQQAAAWLEMVGIASHAGQAVTGQPLGILKRLEVARALALEPRLLLLDEPLAGLNHVEAERFADTLMKINAQGLSVVMIEHNLGEVLRISQRLVVLDNGCKIADGHPAEVMRMNDVRAAYVGKEKTHAAS